MCHVYRTPCEALSAPTIKPQQYMTLPVVKASTEFSHKKSYIVRSTSFILLKISFYNSQSHLSDKILFSPLSPLFDWIFFFDKIFYEDTYINDEPGLSEDNCLGPVCGDVSVELLAITIPYKIIILTVC